MVLDSSALLAILLDEPESEDIRNAIEADATRLLSAASFLETAMVIETRFDESGGRELDLLLSRGAIEVVAFDRERPGMLVSRIVSGGRAGIPLA